MEYNLSQTPAYQPVARIQLGHVLRYAHLTTVPQGPILLAKPRTETHTRLLDHRRFSPRLLSHDQSLVSQTPRTLYRHQIQHCRD